MFWADTNAGLLKMRNGANTAWVTLGQLGAINLGHMLPGSIVYHAKNAAPAGYLKCNGAAVSRTTYADLFTEIGTTFGAGDGSTTFNLPELRGEGIRGWDDSRGIDSGRTFGSAQAQALPTHRHLSPMGWDGASMWGIGSPNPGFGDLVTANGGSSIIQVMSGLWNAQGATNIRLGYTRTDADSVTGELRMRNVALLACIKY